MKKFSIRLNEDVIKRIINMSKKWKILFKDCLELIENVDSQQTPNITFKNLKNKIKRRNSI